MDSLSDVFQKAVYFGVGLAAYTAEKFEKLDDSLSDLKAQVEQILDECIERGEQVVQQTQQSTSPGWEVLGLHRRLLELVNGNEDLAVRLVEQTKAQNPHRSSIWVYEKVIRDLERDRA